MHRALPLFAACGLLFSLFSGLALADADHDRTQVGHSITVGPDERVSDATCFGCSIRVRGQVSGDVTSFGGSIFLEDQAQIAGDATALGGNVRLDKGVKVDGDVTAFGGSIRRDPAATVGGDVTNMSGPGWILLIFVLPLAVFAAMITFLIWLIRRLLSPSVPAAA
jgi:hypothetical protein